jgi:thiamine pyrophosphate-dependent acetolactate synthase large subunit-like protein
MEANMLAHALKRALDSRPPAVVDVVIDQNTLAPVAYRK